MRGHQRRAQGVLAVLLATRRCRTALGQVRNVNPQSHDAVGSRQPDRRHRQPESERPRFTHQPADRRVENLDRPVAWHLLDAFDRGLQQRGQRNVEPHTRDPALVPGQMHRLAARQPIDPDEAVPDRLIHGPPHHVQESHLDLQVVALAGVDQTFGTGGVVLSMWLGVRGGCQDAELPAHPVLRRRGAVRVEDVALEQHRVGDRAGAGEQVCRGGHECTPASSSRVAKVSSQLGSIRVRR